MAISFQQPVVSDTSAFASWRVVSTPGWHHVCFRVADVDAAIEQLKNRAVAVVSEPHDVVAMGYDWLSLQIPGVTTLSLPNCSSMLVEVAR